MREPDSSLRMILVSIQQGVRFAAWHGRPAREVGRVMAGSQENWSARRRVRRSLTNQSTALAVQFECGQAHLARDSRAGRPCHLAQPRNLVFAVCKDRLLSLRFDAC
jgi:hypothetical protein